MENLNVKIKENKELNKHQFFDKYKNLFKIISISLGNVIFEYQLRDFMFVTGTVKTESQYENFLSKAKKHQLLKEENFKSGDKIVYVAKDYVIQNVTDVNKGTYEYSDADAIISYYKMFYILECIKPRLSAMHKITELSQVFLDYTTMHVGKSQHLQIYNELKKRDMLNLNGEIMITDLEQYDIAKGLNLKNKNGEYKSKKLREIMNNEISKQKLEDTCCRIKENKKFWDYNLGKISDNKSFFVFFDSSNLAGYKEQDFGTIDIVKFDTSNNFGNAEIGDYITKVLESFRMHIKEEYRNINLYIYYSSEKRKKDVFTHSVRYKVGRSGVTNLDSNLTSRIKEISRKTYQTRTIYFTDTKINDTNYKASFKVHYSSKNYNPDDFYNVTIYFKNADFDNDIYTEEEQEQNRIKEEEKRKQKEADKIIKDPTLLRLLQERLIELQNE